jgi:hypothetical protein
MREIGNCHGELPRISELVEGQTTSVSNEQKLMQVYRFVDCYSPSGKSCFVHAAVLQQRHRTAVALWTQ